MKEEFNGINYSIEFMRIIGVVLITFTHMRHDYTEGIPYFILETLPRYGTLLLSVISGYLFCMNPGNSNLLQKKIKSLLIPFLIANLVVLIPILIINLLGYNYLNRLNYDYTLLTEGLFSLNSPPINPPTYFIRDLFVIFCIISLIRKNFYSLLFIVPLISFGHLLIRWDIAALFLTGFVIKKYDIEKADKLIINAAGIALILTCVFFLSKEDYHRHITAVLLFLNLVTLNFKFYRTGGYTYLLHLYHCPIMVFSFPILHKIYPNAVFETLMQIGLSATLCYLGFLLIKKYDLRVVVGYRF